MNQPPQSALIKAPARKNVKANLAGSSVAYFLAHTLLKQHRRQYEISRLYLPISSSSNSNSNELVNEYGGHMSSSFPSRSTYNQPGHNKTRDRSESVDTELGAWDADRYYYSGGTTAGDGRMYGDSADESPVGAVVDGKTASRAEGREYENVFDLGEEEEDAMVPGGQRS
ncbi:hypothetical protein QFC22_003627 [Naganishia vaughanmartiniae]|uniref:Uncharacterized protein n=1 Tax=Naganishia vaughanmartiniae TaxID=1424756 RepID=A0ACC2X656_9TREE|nr:hypothetical protein QFC22_003627 [Naganishia vaughanmartiniae]